MGVLDAIKAADDRGKPTPLEVPEWGVTLQVQEPSTKEYFAYQRWLARNRNEGEMLDTEVLCRYLAMVLFDDDGSAIFSGEEGFAVLAAKSGKVVSALFNRAVDILKEPLFTDDGTEEAEQESFTETPA